MNLKYDLIVITGATASGKTQIAVNLAYLINAEIISADSRQIYRNMDIGTGKDLNDYIVNNTQIPYHLIDIANPGYKYNVYEYCNDFKRVYNDIKQRQKNAILCGGTGLYIEAVLKDYQMLHVPVNPELREKLNNLDIKELEKILKSYKNIHNRSDLDTVKRAIRAIEIAEFYSRNNIPLQGNNKNNHIVFGIYFDRDERRKKITERLKYRLENGMIQEAENLLKNGLSPEELEYYGLEYKFLSYYLTGKISYDELFTKLNTAIHQFSKRQLTYFRKMEKNDMKINWIDGKISINDKINFILEKIK